MNILHGNEVGHSVFEIRRSEAGTWFKIIPALGGLVSELCINGNEVLYLNRDLLEHTGDITCGGIPILFPICGSLPEGNFTVQGGTFEIPDHGFARNLPWTLCEFVTDKTSKITLELKDSEDTKRMFPYAFHMKYTYILEQNALVIKMSYQNNDEKPLPFYAGFHPFFKVGNKQKLKFGIKADSYYNYNNRIDEKYDGLVDFHKPVDYIFDFSSFSNYECSLIDLTMERKITISASPEYNYMILWTELGKDFICMEPWMGQPDAMNTGVGLRILKSAEILDTWVKIQVDGLQSEE